LSRAVLHSNYIPIVFIKEYYWCPMEAYLKLSTWLERPTESMMAGAETTERDKLVELLETRHRLREIYWELMVRSNRLGIIGRADLVATTSNDRIVVAEVKLSPISKKKLRTRDMRIAIQLAAYSIAAEETLRLPLEKAYVYSVEAASLIEIPITPHLRRLVEQASIELHKMIETQSPPQIVRPSPRKCRVCSYRRVCPAALT